MKQNTRTLHDLQASMRKAQGLEACLALLPGLLDLAEGAMNDLWVGAGRLDLMAGYLGEIRFLLGEVDRYAGLRIDHPAVLRMAERYLDLEGRVKELRNDRSSLPGGGSARGGNGTAAGE